MLPPLRHLSGCLLASLVAVMLVASSFGLGGAEAQTAADPVKALLERVERAMSDRVRRDTNGNVVYLRLYADEAHDGNLALLPRLPSLQELVISSRGPSPLTSTGIQHLATLPRLSSLVFACNQKIAPGVLKAASELKQIQRLKLHGAGSVPDNELTSLSRMTNLEELTITYQYDFGNRELQILTNLMRLRKITVYAANLTPESAQVLPQFRSLTNANLDNRNWKTNWVRLHGAVKDNEPAQTTGTNRIAGCLGQTNRFPLILRGRKIAGVESTFVITNYVATNGTLEGFVTLTNVEPDVRKLMIAMAFNYHVQLETREEEKIYPLIFETPEGGRMGFKPNWEFESVTVLPKAAKQWPFKINLPKYFDIAPNIPYTLSFIFDLRGVEKTAGDPFVPWSEDSICVVYTGKKLVYDEKFFPN